MTTDAPGPLTEEELAEMDIRANAAAPGPWEWAAERCDPELMDADDLHSSVSWKASQRHWVLRGTWHNDSTAGVGVHPDDAAFIAHARTDIPRLIAEVERLRVERDGARADLRLLRQRLGHRSHS